MVLQRYPWIFLSIEVIGLLPFASSSCSILLLLFLKSWSFLTFGPSELSFLDEDVLRPDVPSSVPMLVLVLLFWFAAVSFLLSSLLCYPFSRASISSVASLRLASVLF